MVLQTLIDQILALIKDLQENWWVALLVALFGVGMFFFSDQLFKKPTVS
ncbi:MAG: hypothetical protein WC098_03530 [Bacteroidales bacterium]|jgi:hypothetical protein|nr:hypothetical protein [Bacteroidales bacterium]